MSNRTKIKKTIPFPATFQLQGPAEIKHPILIDIFNAAAKWLIVESENRVTENNSETLRRRLFEKLLK